MCVTKMKTAVSAVTAVSPMSAVSLCMGDFAFFRPFHTDSACTHGDSVKLKHVSSLRPISPEIYRPYLMELVHVRRNKLCHLKCNNKYTSMSLGYIPRVAQCTTTDSTAHASVSIESVSPQDKCNTTCWLWVAVGTAAFFALTSVGLAVGLGVPLANANQGCQLSFPGNTHFSEATLLNEAKSEHWSLQHPHGPRCECDDTDHTPVWMAPGDICTVKGLTVDDWSYCDPSSEFSNSEHVKVCVSTAELQVMWEDGLCQNEMQTSDIQKVTMLHHGNRAVNVAYDGTLFCAGSLRFTSVACIGLALECGRKYSYYACRKDVGCDLQTCFPPDKAESSYCMDADYTTELTNSDSARILKGKYKVQLTRDTTSSVQMSIDQFVQCYSGVQAYFYNRSVGLCRYLDGPQVSGPAPTVYITCPPGNNILFKWDMGFGNNGFVCQTMSSGAYYHWRTATYIPLVNESLFPS